MKCHLSMQTLNRLALGLTVLLMGCGVKPDSPPPTSATPVAVSPAGDATVAQVCATTARMFDMKPSEIQPETSLADLEADELDFVELVMELEEQFNVTIDDEVVEGLTGTSDWREGMKNLTMSKLASAVEQQGPSGDNAGAESSEE